MFSSRRAGLRHRFLERVTGYWSRETAPLLQLITTVTAAGGRRNPLVSLWGAARWIAYFMRAGRCEQVSSSRVTASGG
jgi:hypothetical protein